MERVLLELWTSHCGIAWIGLPGQHGYCLGSLVVSQPDDANSTIPSSAAGRTGHPLIASSIRLFRQVSELSGKGGRVSAKQERAYSRLRLTSYIGHALTAAKVSALQDWSRPWD